MPQHEPAVERNDVEALLEVRRELGPSYDAALVDSFAERIERAVAERVDKQVELLGRSSRREDDRDSKQLALGIVSLGTGIPLTAIAAEYSGLTGMLVAWAGIVGVNAAHALRSKLSR